MNFISHHIFQTNRNFLNPLTLFKSQDLFTNKNMNFSINTTSSKYSKTATDVFHNLTQRIINLNIIYK